MPVEKDSHPDLAGVANDLVHDLQCIEPLKIRISVEVDAAWDTPGIERLRAVREPKRVVSEALHLVEHVSPISRPEPVRAERVGFHAEPVDAGHPHRLIIRIQNLAPIRMPESVAAAG